MHISVFDLPVIEADLITDSWARIYISERACRDNSHAYNTWKDQPHIKRHLDAFEADWAKSEGITVQELRDALRKQDADYHAQHSDEEILAMCRAHLETLRSDHSAASDLQTAIPSSASASIRPPVN